SQPFCRELEVQAQSGIRLSVVEFEALNEATRRGPSGPAIFGPDMAVVFSGIDGDGASQAAVVLTRLEIQELSETYNDVLGRSIPWKKFKSQRSIEFDRDEVAYITRRSREVRALARYLLENPDVRIEALGAPR